MGLLSALDLVAGYGPADEILKGVSLDVEPAEIVAIIGPNGAGKSTLLKVLAGLLTLHRGQVTLDGRPIHGRPAREVSALGVAFVPQEQNVFPTMTVRDNLEIGGYLEPRRVRARIEAIFERFPTLGEKRRHAARTLSGGQRQILAMAMALMVEPRVLLLDEPSAGLAPQAAERLFETIAAIRADGVAVVMVEQNALEALAIARRGVILVDGRNSRSGPAAELAADPDVRRIFLGGSESAA
ncbi:MAG TPA: ABC transporter ATP-binding protein [Candidatus Dormibacteraeota bacterium]|jgi:branched-chain amino acid transport system ATP-binding protein|nr:ABC transporter ATP-binding protein [Candidatus Dormibacteraeota bacterium]